MVSVALFVRLEAKAGKEKEVEDFLRGGFPIVRKSRPRPHGLGSALGRRRSASLTPSRMRRVGKHTLRVASQRR